MPLDESRFLALTGAINFRDMGGYGTADGRRVRWRRLYRSGATHAMTDNDIECIASRGIRYLCDFRSKPECQRYPSRLTEIPNLDYWSRDHHLHAGDLSQFLNRTNVHSLDIRSTMQLTYRRLPYDLRDAYRELFVRLANNRLPLLFNCMAGKDRTGVAAALILSALGVPRAAIDEDYLMSERCFPQICNLFLDGVDGPSLREVAQELWEPIFRADAAYLDAMFEALEDDHGGIERYLSDVLGIDESMVEKLRDNLLE
jgi:protein-tyrosine phosphatase